MATNFDQLVGYGMMLVSGIIFSYYTLWVIILPFVDDDHFVQQFFLPRIYALIIPISAGCILLSIIGTFIGFVMLKQKKKAKTS